MTSLLRSQKEASWEKIAAETAIKTWKEAKSYAEFSQAIYEGIALAYKAGLDDAEGIVSDLLPEFVPDADTEEQGNRNVVVVHKMLDAIIQDIRLLRPSP